MKVNERVNITFSCPLFLKKQAEKIISKKNFEEGKKLSLSNFVAKSLNCYVKAQKAQDFKDFKDIFSEIFINNKNIDLQTKYKIVNDFLQFFEKMKEEFDEYYAYKKLKNVNDESVKKVEELGEMASWIKQEIRQKNEKSK